MTELPKNTADEFTCESCHRTIFSTPPRIPPPTRCALCTWMDEYIQDAKEREMLKQKYCK
jgi:hypothetical protein